MSRKSTPSYITENDIFAERLREAMTKEHQNQSTLAQKIGVQRQTISLYMNGQSKPDVDKLAKICAELSVSADWLLGNTDDSTPPKYRSAVDDLGLSERAVSIIRIMNENDKRFVTRFSNENDKRFVTFLSNMIESSHFGSFLSDCIKYLNHQTAANPDIAAMTSACGTAALDFIKGAGYYIAGHEEMAEIEHFRASRELDKMLDELIKKRKEQNDGQHQAD